MYVYNFLQTMVFHSFRQNTNHENMNVTYQLSIKFCTKKRWNLELIAIIQVPSPSRPHMFFRSKISHNSQETKETNQYDQVCRLKSYWIILISNQGHWSSLSYLHKLTSTDDHFVTALCHSLYKYLPTYFAGPIFPMIIHLPVLQAPLST